MKDITHDGFFLLRTPSFERSGLINLKYDFDKELKEALKSKKFLNSILISSPQLYSRIKDWKFNNDEKIFNSIKSGIAFYYLRSRYRCTPFGAFAGVSKGSITKSDTIINEEFTDRNNFYLDNYFLFGLYEKIISNKNYILNSILDVNCTTILSKTKFRYIERKLIDSKVQYKLTSIKASEAIQAAVNAARHGAHFSEICEHLISLFEDLKQKDVEQFILALCENNLLVPRFCLPITTDSLEYDLKQGLSFISDVESKIIHETLDIISHEEIFNDYDKSSQTILSNLRVIDSKINQKDAIQVNQFKFSPCININSEILDRIKDAALSILSVFNRKIDHFVDFRIEYQNRYEGMLAPLLEVLDEETGIQFGKDGYITSELLEKVPMFSRAANTKDYIAEVKLSLFEQLVCSRIKNSDSPIFISPDDVRKISQQSNKFTMNLPDAAIMGKLHRKKDGNLILQLDSVGPSPAIKTIGRFANLDNELRNDCISFTTKMEKINNNVCFAEICHLPENKLGNIIVRPAFHSYEIPLLTPSKASSEEQIPLSDLYVYISEHSEICLYSKKLKKRVIPRLTNAHNFLSKSLKMYKFFGLLQSQSSVAQAFSIDSLAHFYNHIPRVTFQNIIICPETWFVDKQDILEIDTSDPEKFNTSITNLAEKYKLKDILIHGTGDNLLPFSINNNSWFSLLQKQAKNATSKSIKLVEYVGFDSDFYHGQRFEQEILIPLLNTKPVYNSALGTECYFDNNCKYSPLDEWSTIKLFGGKKELDDIIANVIGPYIIELKSQGRLEKWFFIRYNIPSWHLRIRLKGKNKEDILLHLNSIFNNHGLSKFELAPYIRENTRYGGSDYIDHAEDVFDADSEFFIISAHSKLFMHNNRWRISIVFLKQLLEEVYEKHEERLSYVKSLRDSLSLRYTNSKQTRKSIGLFCSENEIAKYIAEQDKFHKPLSQYITMLKRAKVGKLSTSFEMVLSSIIHMHVNRFSVDGGPEVEYIIYDILFRYFSSQINKKG